MSRGQVRCTRVSNLFILLSIWLIVTKYFSIHEGTTMSNENYEAHLGQKYKEVFINPFLGFLFSSFGKSVPTTWGERES